MKLPKYKVGDQFEDKEPPRNGTFTILAVSKNPNRHNEWVYFFEVEWTAEKHEFDHELMTEKDIRRTLIKKS
jgi:hypothetical protein